MDCIRDLGFIDEEDSKYLQQTVQALGFQPYALTNLSLNHILHSPIELPSLNNWNNRFDRTSIVKINSRSSLNLGSHKNKCETESSFVSSPITSEHQYDPSKIFDDMIFKGVDEEDLIFLERCFNDLKYDDRERYWTRKVKWIDHPTTVASEIDFADSLSCARTVVWNRSSHISKSWTRNIRKNRQQSSRVSESFAISPYGKNYKGIKHSASRDARNDQRRMHTAYASITESNLLKLNELKFRKKKLHLGKSKIHGLGIFTSEDIQQNDIIIEYVGQIIRPIVAELREKKYKSTGIGSYCFKIDEETIIDATKHGNLNRFINHSCEANSYARKLTINGKKKIVIYSKRFIKTGEEITFDYKLPIENDKIVCLCKSSVCRKTLN